MKQFTKVTETVVDAGRRVSLGEAGVAEDARYAVSVSEDGDILLTPVQAVPPGERWLWENETLLASVQRGIEQAAAGETHDLGSFAQYLHDEN